MNNKAEPKPDDRLSKSQYFELSWRWFEYHATQRTVMFNFFLIASGILATAFVTAYDKEIPLLVYGTGTLGMIIALAFFGLDWRNSDLVELGEGSLKVLEENAENFPEKIFTDSMTDHRVRIVSHGFIMKAVHFVIFISFGVAMVYAPSGQGEPTSRLAKVQLTLDVDGDIKNLQCDLSKSNTSLPDCYYHEN